MILKSIYGHICVETLHSVFNKTEALIVKLGILDLFVPSWSKTQEGETNENIQGA